MHCGWDGELTRLEHARVAFGPDGALTEQAHRLARERHPLSRSARRHVVAAGAWTAWSLVWLALFENWHPQHAHEQDFQVLALLGWLAGLSAITGSAWATRRDVLALRARYLSDLRGLTSRSVSAAPAPGGPGRPR